VKIKLIAIDVLDTGDGERDLNAFLGSHRVLALSKKLVCLNERAYWLFCIEYADASSPRQTGENKKSRIDYKELLSPEAFQRFARLREVRKALAERDKTPVYVVSSNAQLAAIAKKKITTVEALSSIEGFGDAKIAKYGPALLKCIEAEGAGSDEEPESCGE